MKSISEYLTESNGDYKINFTTKGALAIYACELEGQISDGYWENARPSDHWKWVSRTEPVYNPGGEAGYTGPMHRKNYSCDWVSKYVRKALKGNAGDWDWTIRIFNYGKYGSVIPDGKINSFAQDAYYIRSVIEKLPKERPEDLQAFLDELKGTAKYLEKDITSYVSFDPDLSIMEAYYKSRYDLNDFLEDLDNASDSMNTKI